MQGVGEGVCGGDGEVEADAPVAEDYGLVLAWSWVGRWVSWGGKGRGGTGEEGEGFPSVVGGEAIVLAEFPADDEEGYCECVEGL